MIKKEVQYIVFDSNDKEKEASETVRFLYSLPAIKLFEFRTGKNFFDEYSKAMNAFSKVLIGAELSDIENLEVNEQMNLLPLISDKNIINFLSEAIPCFYGVVENGRLVQNEETAERAEFSLWLGELLNIEFFGELLQEINKNQKNAPLKKAKK